MRLCMPAFIAYLKTSFVAVYFTCVCLLFYFNFFFFGFAFRTVELIEENKLLFLVGLIILFFFMKHFIAYALKSEKTKLL